MADSLTNLKTGTILDSGVAKYKITNVLGKGGFGVTYLVTGEVQFGNVTTEAKFAIKEHYPSIFCDRKGDEVIAKEDKVSEYERSMHDFIAEAKKLHTLGTQNENIVKVNEVFEANGTAYYVMQYINGESLETFVKEKGKLSYNEAIKILAPIMDAVEYLHKSRINHLDIKPDNIMLHQGINGVEPVLIDFGLSVHFKKSGGKTSPKGVQGVSDGYSPLEQYAGVEEFNPATDIYSLAATLLFALTGKKPKSASELKISDVRAELSKFLDSSTVEGICKALNKSDEDRTSSVALLKSDLNISDNNNSSETHIIKVNPIKEKRWIYLGFSLFIIAIIVCGIIFWPSKEEPFLDQDENTQEIEQQEEQVQQQEINAPEIINIETSTSNTNTTDNSQNQLGNTSGKTEDKPVIVPAKNDIPAKPAISYGSLSLGYATWEGGIKNGKPDGEGKLVFTSTHRVDRSSSIEANAGDFLEATYDNGNLVYGKLYDRSGNLLKTIIP